MRMSAKIRLDLKILKFNLSAMSNSQDQTTEKPSALQVEGSQSLHDESSVGVAFSSVDEAAVLRKMDLRLIPMLSILYLLAFLDRGNIGNAKIEGLVDDLNMTGPQYNWTCKSLPSIYTWNGALIYRLVTVFFFTYCVFELPSNLLLKKLRPSRWLPLIMVAWGIVMVCARIPAKCNQLTPLYLQTLMGVVTSYGGLLATRLFLGVAGMYYDRPRATIY